MRPQSVRGTSDLLPEDVRRWSTVEQTIRRLASLYGYQELRTPLIEDAALFLRSVGETTDIVQKEMFRFSDRGGHEIVLRPEGTVPIVRAYLEHSLHKTHGFMKVFYLGPMFRAERPQAGRFRQFHQYGVEAIGSGNPWVDVEVIALCLHVLRECGLVEAPVWLASMGCRADQARSAEQLRQRLAPHRATLCQECQSRLERNVFRILDCKNPTCHAVAWETGQRRAGQGSSVFLLCKDCQHHFDEVRRGLAHAKVAFDDTKVFARGLDYYTRTVFEVRAKGLGAQDAVAAGGRYDHLVEELGGPAMGAVGFAAGIERLLLATQSQTPERPADSIRKGLYVAVARPGLLTETFRLVQELRQRAISVVMDLGGRSVKSQLRDADKSGSRWVVVIGEQELATRSATFKDLAEGGQHATSIEAFVSVMKGEPVPETDLESLATRIRTLLQEEN